MASRTLRVLEAGDPNGPTVVVHHGTPGSRVLWRGLVEDAEARGIRLFSYDRPGYGGSDPDPARDVAAAARDVGAIADALDVERLAVEGGSGGGPHALACAALLSDRVVAVASLAGIAPYSAQRLDWLDGMGQDNLEEFEAAVKGREALEDYLLAERHALLAGDAEAVALALHSLLSPPDLAVLSGEVARFFYQQIRTGIVDRIEGWLDDDLAFVRPWGFDVAQIEAPVQVWHGVQDRFVPIAHGRWLADRIPRAEVQIYENEGHLTVQLEHIGDVHGWLCEHF